MALTIVSRESAGLPQVPASIGRRALSSWAGIKVHHTGGAFSSWKAVHDWQTAGRPVGERLAYIGYSFGVANGRVTELRGWDRQPAHDHENSTLGVVFGGNFTGSLPAPADLAAFVEFVRLARARIGRAVPVTGHRDTWPAGDWRYSSCPGDRLYAHLPALRRAADEEDDDDMDQNEIVRHTDKNVAFHLRNTLRGVGQLEAGQAALLAKLGGEDWAAALRAELDRAAEAERAEREAEHAELHARLAGLSAVLVDELGPALVAALGEAAGQLPAEVVEAAVGRALQRTSLTVAPPA